MTNPSHAALPAAAKQSAVVLAGRSNEYGALLERTRGARIVLIGEASHGTHEFYADRAAITRWLIDEHRFTAVAVEADWPDAYRVNNFVRERTSDRTATRRSADSSAFRPGYGATRTASNSWTGSARATRGSTRRATGPASTASISTACSRRSGR